MSKIKFDGVEMDVEVVRQKLAQHDGREVRTPFYGTSPCTGDTLDSSYSMLGVLPVGRTLWRLVGRKNAMSTSHLSHRLHELVAHIDSYLED